jgi:hypothetical protein
MQRTKQHNKYLALLVVTIGLACFFVRLQHNLLQNLDQVNKNNSILFYTESSTATYQSFNNAKNGVKELPILENIHALSLPEIKKNKYEPKEESSPRLNLPIRIPSEPDPMVMTHLSRAWTEKNGDELEYLKLDPYLKWVRTGGNCPVTAQLQLNISDKNWTLQSLDGNGIRKTMGGDEYYVTYQDEAHFGQASPTAIAYVCDQKDGLYKLDFVQSPFHSDVATLSGYGLLTIDLQFTCGFGKLEHGTKRLWNTGGTLMIQYNVSVSNAPPIRAFQVPNADAKIDLSKYSDVLVYGDSNLQMLSLLLASLHPNLRFLNKPGVPLTSQSMKRKHLKETRQELNETLHANPKKTLALLTGSSTWDIIFGVKHGKTFRDHRQACKEFIETLHTDFPTVDLYWFSGLAIHVHVLRSKPDWHLVDALKYMSMSRASMLYKWQMEIMSRLEYVRVIDVFEASYFAAEHMQESDARHFDATFNLKIADWVYPNKT